MVAGLGACLLITLRLTPSRAVCALVSPVPIWLGRISCSLYLVHLPILMLIVSGRWIPAIPGLALMLVVATLTQAAIEAPAHRRGVKLSENLANA